MALRMWWLTAFGPTPFSSEWRRIVRWYISLTRTGCRSTRSDLLRCPEGRDFRYITINSVTAYHTGVRLFRWITTMPWLTMPHRVPLVAYLFRNTDLHLPQIL